LHTLLERLRTSNYQSAAAELLQRGAEAIPALIEALEWRDVEMRQRAFEVLQLVVKVAIPFDPYAPEGQRRQDLAVLRERFLRKAG
jgi:hypothetical protein